MDWRKEILRLSSGQKIGSEFLISHHPLYFIGQNHNFVYHRIMIKMTPKRIANFWLKVKKCSNECWEWTASRFKNGYGRFQINPHCHKAHRISYFLIYGEIPNNKIICHRCDNPSCVNPSHLFLGTAKENTLDMISKGRLNRSRGENKGISYRKETGKWRARYMKEYKNILVGEFDTKEEAVAALQKARKSP